MKGRLVMVTGANSGIGLETSKGLARMGARLILVCRDRGRCEKAMEEIRVASGSDEMEMMLADLSSQASIRALAEEFSANHDRLDVLFNNAALIPHERKETVDGVEMQLAINHLAPFLLTNLLLPVLKQSAPSRVVTTSSGVHVRGRIDWDDLQAKKGYRPMGRYGTTKLMNILFTRSLSRRLEGSGVTANCLTPGFKATGLSRDYGFLMRGIVNLIAGKPSTGAVVPLHVITSPDLEGVSGKYFSRKSEIVEPSSRARDDEAAERLWRESMRLVNLGPEEKHWTRDP
jgi:NAD(P)-dependent dehydrogenase (short-subunit alcohol dehydrogenase family)